MKKLLLAPADELGMVQPGPRVSIDKIIIDSYKQRDDGMAVLRGIYRTGYFGVSFRTSSRENRLSDQIRLYLPLWMRSLYYLE